MSSDKGSFCTRLHHVSAVVSLLRCMNTSRNYFGLHTLSLFPQSSRVVVDLVCEVQQSQKYISSDKTLTLPTVSATIVAMTSPTPRVTIARPSGSNGLLSIPASAIQKRIEPASEGTASRPTTARLKLIIRRLPPGLTQLEFQGALGPDWKVSGPRVDWMIYKPGKVSRE